MHEIHPLSLESLRVRNAHGIGLHILVQLGRLARVVRLRPVVLGHILPLAAALVPRVLEALDWGELEAADNRGGCVPVVELRDGESYAKC